MLSFSHIKPHNMLQNGHSDPAGAKRYVRDTINQMRTISLRSLEWWNITVRERRLIDDIIGRHRQISNCFASNLALRGILAMMLIDMLDAMAKTHPQRRFMLVTLISDRWLSYDRDVYIWLGGMQYTARKVMSRGGFDGWFGMAELQSLSESEAGFGRILLPHFHAVAWTDDASFDFETAESKMAKSKRLISTTGAPTATISLHSETHAANLAAYVMKAPCVAKCRVPDLHSPAGFRLAPTELAPTSAVRLLEILSHMYFDELMLAGGDGRDVRTTLKRHMIESAKAAYGFVDVTHSAKLWQAARRRTKRDKNYYPVGIVHTREQLPASCPISLDLPRLRELRSKRIAYRLEEPQRPIA